MTFSSPYTDSFIAYFLETKIIFFFLELGIPLITTTLGGNNDLERRQSRRASEEDSDYIPLEVEGLDNIAAAATKASKSRTSANSQTIRTRATSKQANDVMLSPGLFSN